ncbi:MAG: type II secretion system protein [Phycisphaerae bacterium]|nr:type II secretion system protein [Phycisphaerae bacterium]
MSKTEHCAADYSYLCAAGILSRRVPNYGSGRGGLGNPPRQRRAFTLIELLVVIAIISLLVSILLPSLQKAKELAKITICATQLRALGMAATTYAEEHEGEYPFTHRGATSRYPEIVHPVFTNPMEEYGCPPSAFYCPFKPYEDPDYDYEPIWTWYYEIGYCYFGAYYNYNTTTKTRDYECWKGYFRNGYHSPINLDSAETGWALMSDNTRCDFYDDGVYTNHWFDDGKNISNNVLFVDLHVENRKLDEGSYDWADNGNFCAVDNTIYW